MRTERIVITDPARQAREVARAAEILKSGGLLAIPTETVYGLGANGLDADACLRIFEVKGRAQDNPLILHIASAADLARWCVDVPAAAWRLAERFWPGPLTMVLRRGAQIPDRVTAGLDTVAMRCPDHPATLAILRRADIPVAAPSANRSGRPSTTSVSHVLEDLDGRVEGVVDGGPCRVGVESTIIDLTGGTPCLLRPGGVPLEALRALLGEVEVDRAVREKLKDGETPRAPGMKYIHYAPRAPLTVVCGPGEASARFIRARLGERSGVLCFDEFRDRFPARYVYAFGPEGDTAEQARRVFDGLRWFDGTDAPEIFAQCPEEEALGLAVSNRLRKAASRIITAI